MFLQTLRLKMRLASGYRKIVKVRGACHRRRFLGRRSVVPVVVVAALSVSACGGSEPVTQPPPETPSPAATATPPPAGNGAVDALCRDLDALQDTMMNLISGEASPSDALNELDQVAGRLDEHAARLEAEGRSDAAQGVQELSSAVEDVRTEIRENGDVAGAIAENFAGVSQRFSQLSDLCS